MNCIKRVVLTEKTNGLIEESVYTFEVYPKTNKIELKKEIEEMFGVKVKKINIINYKGKMKRQTYVKNKFSKGIKNRYKKAIVMLHEGEDIDIYSYGIEKN